MADASAPMTVSLAWDGSLEFTGLAGRHEVGIDGATYAASSPMQLLALGVAGCMAVDLVHVLTKGRHELTSLSATFTGARAKEEPRRFTSITLHFILTTSAPPAAIERAIQLSREKYCSAWNSLRQDISLTVTYELTSPLPFGDGGR